MLYLKVLYSFQYEDVALIEVKRLDLPADAPVGDVYHWFFIGRDQIVVKLHFKSMKSIGGDEFREFTEGSLKFDQRAAELNLKGKIINLMSVNDLPQDKLDMAERFLGMA